MPRKPNPSPPGRGAHFKRGGSSYNQRGNPRRTYQIDTDIARQLRAVHPDIDVQHLINALLVQWISSATRNAPPPTHGGEKDEQR